MSYIPKMPLMPHQERVFELSKDAEYYGLFLDMGLGKTKLTLDTAFYLSYDERINGLCVVAPSGVHVNWLDVELPKHHPDGFPVTTYLWNSAKTQKNELLQRKFMSSSLFQIMAINVEAVRTAAGFAFVSRFLESGPRLLVVDESTIIATPGAQQTKALMKLSELAAYRRILSGSPVRNHSGDMWSQCMFLDKNSIPYPSFTAFRRQFLVEELMDVQGGRKIPKIVGNRNSEILTEALSKFSLRLLKKDCLDLPEKIYDEDFVSMTPEQERVYQDIKEKCIAELQDEKQRTGVVSATSVLSILMKLSQIANGFVMDDQGQSFDLPCLKFDRLAELCRTLFYEGRKVVIWSVFRNSVQRIHKMLEEEYGNGMAELYYGGVDKKDRPECVRRFQEGDSRFFVTNMTAARGLTLHAASDAIYFSNTYSSELRTQSEDRIHRIGQSRTCNYMDMFTKKTVDRDMFLICKGKIKMAAEFLEPLVLKA